jgi:hypothetical protein
MRLEMADMRHAERLRSAIESIPDNDRERGNWSHIQARRIFGEWVAEVVHALSGSRPDIAQQFPLTGDEGESRDTLREAYEKRRKLLERSRYQDFWQVNGE